MDIDYFKRSIYDGMVFKKVKGISKILRVREDGFTYDIGKNGNYKKVTFVEVERAIQEIEYNGSINRKWYTQTFYKIASSNPCNFTSIGGVLQELGYVIYSNNEYKKQ